MTGYTRKRDRRDPVRPRRESDLVRAAITAEAGLIRARLERWGLDGMQATDDDASRPDDGGT